MPTHPRLTDAATAAPRPRRRPGLLAAALVAAALLVVLVVALLVGRPWQSGPQLAGPTAAPTAGSSAPSAEPSATLPPLVAPDTHLLSDAGPDAPVIVEFLDFECEVCGAVYPTMEALREEYGTQVTFAVRYFPLPGHGNAVNAALAVEAAAQQGQFEAMYQRMFETQAEWGEQQSSEAPRFRGYAEELGLDMAAFDAALAAEETLQRVEADLRAGMELGVDRTPTIFVDGERLELRQLSDIEDAVADAAQGG